METFINRYNDITIQFKHSTIQDNSTVSTFIQEHIPLWKKQGINAIWIHVPNTKDEIIPTLHQLHFTNHHCSPQHITLTLWLQDSESKLPDYGTHIVRIECILIRENPDNPFQKELLLIQEKDYTKKEWKLVTGNVDSGEHIEQAAIREMKEEVGLDVSFVSILGYGNRTNSRFGRNEIFFICHMELKNKQQELILQEDEISQAQWFHIYDILSKDQDIFLKGLQKKCLLSALHRKGMAKFISSEQNQRLHAHFVSFHAS